jgi:hypothetical protein
MEELRSVLDEVRPQRDQMLQYLRTNLKNHGRMPVDSYRLVHAFIETLEALESRDLPAARMTMKRWEAIANAMLDRQLFSDAPNTVAISMSNPEQTISGADGATLQLSQMIRHHRAILLEGVELLA